MPIKDGANWWDVPRGMYHLGVDSQVLSCISFSQLPHPSSPRDALPWSMRKPIRVFSHDSDPASDSPIFFISIHDAEDRVTKGYASYLAPLAIQNRPPVGWSLDQSEVMAAGLFNQAWMPRWSANYIVWQMRSDQFAVEAS